MSFFTFGIGPLFFLGAKVITPVIDVLKAPLFQPIAKIIFKKDFRLAPGREIIIYKETHKTRDFICSLQALKSNQRTIIIKSRKQYEISEANEEIGGKILEIYVKKKVEDKSFGFLLSYVCERGPACFIDHHSNNCGGLVTITHQKPVEF